MDLQHTDVISAEKEGLLSSCSEAALQSPDKQQCGVCQMAEKPTKQARGSFAAWIFDKCGACCLLVFNTK